MCSSIEATFLEEDLARAERALHTTAAQTARVAQQAEVSWLILTHQKTHHQRQQAAQLQTYQLNFSGP
jgi:ribonuclease BN (tRNA processing enzyme)